MDVWCVFSPVEGYFELEYICDNKEKAEKYLKKRTDSITRGDWKIEHWIVR